MAERINSTYESDPSHQAEYQTQTCQEFLYENTAVVQVRILPPVFPRSTPGSSSNRRSLGSLGEKCMVVCN